MRSYDIVTIDGDGIGPEVCRSVMRVLEEACGASRLNWLACEGGAGRYQASGELLPASNRQSGRSSPTLGWCRATWAFRPAAAK